MTIPCARELVKKIPPVAVRLRRDVGSLLALIRSHAVLHQANRGRDDHGRIIADLDDYAVVRGLVADIMAEGVGTTVSKNSAGDRRRSRCDRPKGRRPAEAARRQAQPRQVQRRRLTRAADTTKARP